MDSGNSGSMNSSSGDEEYDSRTDQSIPSFLNPSLTHFGSSDPNSSDPSQLLSHHLFDLQPNTSNPNNFLLNLDTTTIGPRSALTMRSDHHQPYQLGLMTNNPQTSSTPNIQQPIMFPATSPIQLQPSQLPNETLTTTTSTTASTAIATASTSSTAALRSAAGSSSQTGVVRNSKKRTRASRRAPTTVLTTDTSNFRAMVQEFTGIPAPPFSASISPFSRRLDLFGSSGLRSGGGGGAHLDGPLYPLVRPSAIKPQTSPFGSVPSSSSSSMMFGNVMVDATNIATSSLSYPPPPPSSSSDHHQGLMINKQPMRNVLSMHNQNQNQGLNMAFQVQSHQLPLHPNSGSNSLNVAAGFGANKQPQEINVGHGYGGAAMRRDELWRVEGAAAAGSGDMNCKMNYSAAAAAVTAAQPNSTEINVSSRGEGTVDSWIFPSD